MLVFAAILVLQVLIVGLGVLLGYKRGIGRGIVRLVELILIGVVSLLLGRLIAEKIAGKAFSLILPLLGEDIGALIGASESMSTLLIGFVGALLVPLIFAIFFSVLGLLSTILLKKRSRAIVRGVLKKDEDVSAKKNRLIGMGIGAVSAVLIALVLFSPIHTALSLVGNLSDESIALIGSVLATSEDGDSAVDPDAALAVRVTLLKKQGFDIEAFLKEIRAVNAVATPLSLKLTTATTPEGTHYNAVEEAAALTNAVGAAATAITEKSNQEGQESGASTSAISTLTNAATAALPHIAGQPFAKELVASTASAAGQHIQNGGSIGGLSANSGDRMTDIMVNAISEVFVNTTTENLSDTTNTLFGVDLNAIEEQQKEEKNKDKNKDKNTTDTEPEVTLPESTKAPETSKTPETTQPTAPSEPEQTETTVPESSTAPESSKTPESSTAPESSKTPETTPAEPSKQPSTQMRQLGALELLAKVDFSNASAIFKNEEQCNSLISAVYIVSVNPTFAPVVSAFGELGNQLLSENRDLILPNTTEDTVNELYASLRECVENEATYNPTRSLQEQVPAVKSALLDLSARYNLQLSDAQAELGAICIVARFFTPEYMADFSRFSYDEFKAYLGY